MDVLYGGRNFIKRFLGWTSSIASKMFSKGQQMVPICYSCSHSSVQFYWKIDFSFPATGTAAGNLALISGITPLVSSKSL